MNIALRIPTHRGANPEQLYRGGVIKRYPYAILSFISLSVFVLAMALSPSASASEHQAGVHAARSVTHQRIGETSVGSEVPTVVPHARIGGGGGGACTVGTGNPNINFRTEAVSGSSTIISCVGAAECSSTASLQEESPTNPGNWYTVATGRSGGGCSPGNGSIVVKKCTSTAKVWHDYRTRGIYTIFWDNGSVTSGATFYSGTSALQWAC